MFTNLLVTPDSMRTLEALTDAAGVSYREMMLRAGKALAMCIESQSAPQRSVCFLAGTGNNGGDCFVAAKHLWERGWETLVLTPLGSPRTDLAREMCELAVQAGVPVRTQDGDFQEDADIVVDGLFGTGFRGTLPEAAQTLLAPREGQVRIACDIPSGGSGLTGTVSPGTFRAHCTVTFGLKKLGMSQYPLRAYCGSVLIADIGTPPEVLTQIEGARLLRLEDVRTQLPVRPADAHKNTSGHVLSVCGSVRMRGACVLSALSAMRAGAGLVTVASAEHALSALAVKSPECMCMPLETDAQGFLLGEENFETLREVLPGKQALLVGCGLGITQGTRALLRMLLQESTCPVVLDADALNLAAQCRDMLPKGRCLLTPHPGEAARLLGTDTAAVQQDRPGAAAAIARETGCVTVLKGAGTIVSDGTRMAVCELGNAGMARAGSGDVLAGICAALTGQGMGLYEAACTAVTLHAAAGDACVRRLPERFMLPQDLIDSLREVL